VMVSSIMLTRSIIGSGQTMKTAQSERRLQRPVRVTSTCRLAPTRVRRDGEAALFRPTSASRRAPTISAMPAPAGRDLIAADPLPLFQSEPRRFDRTGENGAAACRRQEWVRISRSFSDVARKDCAQGRDDLAEIAMATSAGLTAPMSSPIGHECAQALFPRSLRRASAPASCIVFEDPSAPM